jgi:predicted ATPase
MSNHIKSVNLLQHKFPTHKYYPFKLPVFEQTKCLFFESPITLFVGENGTGKSTLLEAVARACGIHIWSRSEGARCEINPYENQLYRCLKINWAEGHVPGAFFGSDIFKDFTNILDEWAASDAGQLKYFGGKSLVTQSHGQSMMSYFRARYKFKGVYLLDEPETALSPASQLDFLDIIANNIKDGHAQFVISTHSPIILACRMATIYSFDHIPIKTIKYEDTEHYKIYKKFMIDQQARA